MAWQLRFNRAPETLSSITLPLAPARLRMPASHAWVILSQPSQEHAVQEDLRQSNRSERVITTTSVRGWGSHGTYSGMAKRRCVEALGFPIKARSTGPTPTRAGTLPSIHSTQHRTSSWATSAMSYTGPWVEARQPFWALPHQTRTLEWASRRSGPYQGGIHRIRILRRSRA